MYKNIYNKTQVRCKYSNDRLIPFSGCGHECLANVQRASSSSAEVIATLLNQRDGIGLVGIRK